MAMDIDFAAKRRAARRKMFVEDIIEVCKKHKVMISLDGIAEPVEFEEQVSQDDGCCFSVGASELDDVVRFAVLDVLHPSLVPEQRLVPEQPPRKDSGWLRTVVRKIGGNQS